jgi:hypothetical protein
MKKILVLGLLLLSASAIATSPDKPLTKKVVLNAVDASMALRSKYNKGYERNVDSAVKDEIQTLVAESGFDSLTHYHSVVGRILNAYLVHKKKTPMADKKIQDKDIQASQQLNEQQKATLLAARKVMLKVEQDQQARAKQDMPAVLANLAAVEKAFDHPLRKSPPGSAHHHH